MLLSSLQERNYNSIAPSARLIAGDIHNPMLCIRGLACLNELKNGNISPAHHYGPSTVAKSGTNTVFHVINWCSGGMFDFSISNEVISIVRRCNQMLVLTTSSIKLQRVYLVLSVFVPVCVVGTFHLLLCKFRASILPLLL